MRFWAFTAILWYSWEQNEYFGWNMFPQSQAELIADGINVLMWVLLFLSKTNQGKE